MDSAGAPTAVVTPFGETATWPGAAVGVSEPVEPVDSVDEDPSDEEGTGDDDGCGDRVAVSVPGEQAARTAEQITIEVAAVAAAPRGYQRMSPIYATLAAVTDRTADHGWGHTRGCTGDCRA